jgi:predicted Rossmann fold nucleotide-binding protein DprA/Smf involved in DNA uptake
MERDELASWLRLTLTPGIGNQTARKLLAAFGLPQAIFSQSSSALLQVVTPVQAARCARNRPTAGPGGRLAVAAREPGGARVGSWRSVTDYPPVLNMKTRPCCCTDGATGATSRSAFNIAIVSGTTRRLRRTQCAGSRNR